MARAHAHGAHAHVHTNMNTNTRNTPKAPVIEMGSHDEPVLSACEKELIFHLAACVIRVGQEDPDAQGMNHDLDPEISPAGRPRLVVQGRGDR